MTCWTRQEKPEKLDDDSWLTQQLKRTRDQLDKKSKFCDQLAGELRRLETDLEARNGTIGEVRDQLRASNTELRAAALAGVTARAEHEEEVAALRAAAAKQGVEVAQRDNEAGGRAPAPMSTGEVEEGPACQPQGCDIRRVVAAEADTADAEVRAATAAAAAAAAQREVEELRVDLARERELHEEAVRLLRAQRARGDEEVTELQEELKDLSTGLEQKDEEILSIQFNMADLMNRLTEQSQQVKANAEAFQQASEELADKDERLDEAMKTQEELLAKINTVSEQLQGKINRLSQELETSKAAYQALEEQTRPKVKGLQSERDALAAELKKVRADADEQLASLRAELQQREAAAEASRGASEQELRELLQGLESRAGSALEVLREQLKSQKSALAEAPGEPTSSSEVAAAAGVVADLQVALEKASKQRPSRSPSSPSGGAGGGIPPLPAFGGEGARPRASTGLEERLALAEERIAWDQSRIADLTAALERSRLLERQAMERAQEYRTSLALYREFGSEGFLAAAPRGVSETPPVSPERLQQQGSLGRSPSGLSGCEEEFSWQRSGTGGGFDHDAMGTSAAEAAGGAAGEVALPTVLIAVELDLGHRSGTIRVAPWQTRSDFDTIVRGFLLEHNVKPLFTDSLVKYLEVVETEAQTFPAYRKADLAELYSLYG